MRAALWRGLFALAVSLLVLGVLLAYWLAIRPSR